MNMEKWRNVPGFEGKYQIDISTPEGKCRSLDYRRTGNIKEMCNKPDKTHGRIFWTLSLNGKKVSYQAARWIALTFPELVQNEWFEGAEIDHVDTNRLNNHPSNLKWVSQKENRNNPLTVIHNSEAQKGNNLNRKDESKPVVQFTKNGEYVNEYPSLAQAERETGASYTHIADCCTGKRKSCGGYKWSFA